MAAKTTTGNFFEDFQVGQVFRHAVPRTVSEGDLALYIALTGDRRPLHCSREFAQSLGVKREVVHDLLVFHLVFGRAVPDVSLNSPANLGYADVRFLNTVYPGDTLRAETEVIGKRETSRPDVGIVWVRTRGSNQRDEPVLQFYRWAMVNKRDPNTNSGADDAPALPPRVAVEDLRGPSELDPSRVRAAGGLPVRPPADLKPSDGVLEATKDVLAAVREQEALTGAQLSYCHRRKYLAAVSPVGDARRQDHRRAEQVTFFFDRLAGVQADADGQRLGGGLVPLREGALEGDGALRSPGDGGE